MAWQCKLKQIRTSSEITSEEYSHHKSSLVARSSKHFHVILYVLSSSYSLIKTFLMSVLKTIFECQQRLRRQPNQPTSVPISKTKLGIMIQFSLIILPAEYSVLVRLFYLPNVPKIMTSSHVKSHFYPLILSVNSSCAFTLRQ